MLILNSYWIDNLTQFGIKQGYVAWEAARLQVACFYNDDSVSRNSGNSQRRQFPREKGLSGKSWSENAIYRRVKNVRFHVELLVTDD